MSTEIQTTHTDLQPAGPQPSPFAGLQVRTFEDAWKLADIVAKSGLAPKGFQSPEQIFVALQMGAEVGLAPMQALQNIAVINGRPGIYGDAALALVRASGLLSEFSEVYEGQPGTDEYLCRVVSVRRGTGRVETTFSVRDAKTAKLWGKAGPWTDYPARMLKWRARGFNLRDNFGDVLRGMTTVEELRDMGPAIDVTPTPVDPPRPADSGKGVAGLARAVAGKVKPADAIDLAALIGAPEALIVGYLATREEAALHVARLADLPKPAAK